MYSASFAVNCKLKWTKCYELRLRQTLAIWKIQATGNNCLYLTCTMHVQINRTLYFRCEIVCVCVCARKQPENYPPANKSKVHRRSRCSSNWLIIFISHCMLIVLCCCCCCWTNSVGVAWSHNSFPFICFLFVRTMRPTAVYQQTHTTTTQSYSFPDLFTD